MGQTGPVTWSNPLPNSSPQCRLESRNMLKEDHWRGAESGRKEFIGVYKAATPTNSEFGSWSEQNKFSLCSCFFAEGSPPTS